MRQNSSETLAIVEALRDFGRGKRPIPMDLVAKLVGRAPDEIRESLQTLEEKEVVQLDVENQLVSLIG